MNSTESNGALSRRRHGRWTWLAGLTVLAMVVAACGSDESTARDGGAESVDSQPTDEGSEAAEEDPEPTQLDLPALPILAAHEFDQSVWHMVAHGESLYLGGSPGLVALDVNTGEISEMVLAGEDDLRAEVFWVTRSGTHVVASADSTASQGTLDLAVAVDPATFEATGALRVSPLTLFLDQTFTGSEMLTGYDEQYWVLDTESMTLSDEPISYLDSPWQFIHQIDGEVWTVRLDGTGSAYDLASGEELGSFDLGAEQQFLGTGVAYYDDEMVWIGDAERATLNKFDRHTFELLAQVSWADRYGDAVVSLASDDPGVPLVLADVLIDGELWYVLIEFDPESGAVVSEHVVATGSHEYGWSDFDSPGLEVIDGRVFIQDHTRRVVEVDMSRLGDASIGPWVDPGLDREAILTPEQQVVADIALNKKPSSWWVTGAAIDGDRAWVRVRAVDNLGVPYTLRRIDGEWKIVG